MRLRAFAGAAGALFVVLGAAVPPATAAGGGELEVLDSATQGMVSGLFESMLSGPLQVLFKPSAQRLALQRQTSERLLQMASKAFENPRESLDKLKKVLERVLLLEEQRLSTYSSMEALKEHMSTGTFTEEEDANNRRQMQRLCEQLKELTQQADLVPVDWDFSGEEEASRLLSMRGVQQVEQALHKMLLAPFADYV